MLISPRECNYASCREIGAEIYVRWPSQNRRLYFCCPEHAALRLMDIAHGTRVIEVRNVLEVNCPRGAAHADLV